MQHPGQGFHHRVQLGSVCGGEERPKVENSGICALQLAVRFLHLVEVNKRHLKYGVFWLRLFQATKGDRELTKVMESRSRFTCALGLIIRHTR